MCMGIMEVKHERKGWVLFAVLPKIKLCSTVCFIDRKKVPGGGGISNVGIQFTSIKVLEIIDWYKNGTSEQG